MPTSASSEKWKCFEKHFCTRSICARSSCVGVPPPQWYWRTARRPTPERPTNSNSCSSASRYESMRETALETIMLQPQNRHSSAQKGRCT